MTVIKDPKVGDKVMRCLGVDEQPWMECTIMKVLTHTVICAMKGTEGWPLDQLWTFDRETGAEEDEGLQWGVKYGRTGSKIKPI